MKNLSRAGITHEQVYNALFAKAGTKNIEFRYDLIRNGVKYSEVNVLSANVAFNRLSDINRTAQFEICNSEEIDWLNDMVKPYMLLKVPIGSKNIPYNWKQIRKQNLSWRKIETLKLSWREIHNKRFEIAQVSRWLEYPLGVFILSTPTKTTNNGIEIVNVEAYDKTVILQEDCIINRLFLKAGTSYINAIKSILLSANVAETVGDTIETILPTDREFEIGENKLTIINKLLSEINFDPITVDAEGAFTLKKYTEPSQANISLSYKDDELSVLYDEMKGEADFYNVPNVFIAAVSNPELNEDFKSIFVNENPSSKLSTVSRKRHIVSEVYRPDVTPTQEDLDSYIRKIAFEKNQVYEKLTFTTDLMPIHERAEVLEIRNGNLNGIYIETAWSMDLSVEGVMQHEARRLVSI